MISPRAARMLAHYKAWANQLLFDAVAALPPEEIAKGRNTLCKNLVGTLNHNYVIDLVWQAHIERREHGFTARDAIVYPDLDDLWNAQRMLDEWFIAWSDKQSDETLDESIEFSFISGERSVMTAGEMFLHLVNHASYHRGWIAQMFWEIPAKPPITDLSVFLFRSTVKY